MAFISAAPASAAPQQSSREEILEALGVRYHAADYVVVVDTSGSMADDGRFTRATAALDLLVRSLNPTDHISLISFDAGTQVLFRGEVGTDPQAIIRTLPAVPTGEYTDIGAGIEAAIAELERPDAREAGALALVTDGVLAAHDGSPYADPASPAWAALRARADALTARHELAAYAIALQDVTDAGLLKSVFTRAVDVTGDELSRRLGELNRELLDFQARERLTPELDETVRVTWSGIDWEALAASGGTASGVVTLTSNFDLLPVVVEGLRATPSGLLEARVTGLPVSLELTPWQAVEVPVSVSWPESSELTGELTLTGSITSPWRDVMVNELGLEFAPQLIHEQPLSSVAADEPAPELPSPPQVPALPWGQIAAALAGAVLILLLVLLVRNSRSPRMQGSIQLVSPQGSVHELLLVGRKRNLPAVADAGERLTGTITPDPRAAKADPSGSVRLSGRVGGRRINSVLRDGEASQFGDWTLTYTSERSRVLSQISATGVGTV